MPFRDLIGHAQVRALLSRAVKQGTLPPSLLFAGPDGVGKRATAKALAQTLNCLEPFQTADGVDACGRCTACTRIARDLHPDVGLVGLNDKGSIVIESVRDAVAAAAYRPFEGRRRVTMIDPADALLDAAQNALLKTLEEPTSSSVFVLVTSRPDVLLPTVGSRCARLRFGPLAAEDIEAVLVGRGYSRDRARAAAATAGGSLSRALEADSEERVEARAIAAELLRELAERPKPSVRFALAQALQAPVTRKRRKASPASDRELVAGRLEALGALLRDVSLVRGVGDRRWLANADLASEIHELGRGFDHDRVLRAYQAVDRGLAALDRNVSPKVVADWVVMNV